MSTTIKAISDKIATFEKALKSDNTEDFKKKLQDKLAKLKSDLKKASVGEEISAKDLADSLLKSRKKFIEMSSKDFDGVIKRLQTKPEYSFLKSYTRSKIIDDIKRKAKPVGWRFKGRNNFKIPSKEQVKNRRINGVYYENRPDRSDVSQTRQLKHGGYADSTNPKHVLHIDGQNWYLEKIDSTHFYMSNSPDFRGMAHHIGQHKGEPYYEEVREWLKTTTMAKGGSTYQGGGEIKTSQLELHKWYTIDGKELRYFGERGGQYAFQTKNYQEVLFTKPKLDKATIKGISTYQGGGEIKYMVWVGDMPLDINGREELTLEEAELLKREWEEKGYDDVAIDKYSKGGSTYAEGGVITNFMKVNDVRTQLKKQGYSEAKINKAFQGVNVGMDKDYKETVIDREGLKNNLPTQDWKDLATNVVSIIKSDSTYAEGGEIFEYKVKQYSNNHTIKELSEIEDKLLKTKNKSKAQQENLMAITTAIGVKRNPDFYKDKMFKGGSTYAEGGSIEDNQPVIRYYFEDEEYEYAQGGMVEHGLQIGDKILSKGIRTIKVENSGKKYVVNLQNGTREDSSEFYFNKKK